ncbi:MAG: GDSL-type esterase/lipase family protein [Planctomycetaceae bacterium]
MITHLTRSTFAFSFTALLWLCAGPLQAQTPFEDGDRVVFLGDSITQDGRYVALIESYLWATQPEDDIDVVNAGLSSETVSGITEPIHPNPRPNIHTRVDRALELTKPDWVVVCYGMNDGIYHPVEPRIVDTYRDGLTKLVDRIASQGARVVLLTPPSFDVDVDSIQKSLKEAKEDEPYGYRKPFAKYNETLVALAKVVQSLAEHQGVERIIDIHSVTDEYLKQVKAAKPDYQYGDGVHPPLDGHLAIALGVLEGLGCDRAKATDTLVELTGIQSPIGKQDEPQAEQNRFRDALFARFLARSVAYRKAIGSADPKDAQAIAEADQKASDAEQSLRESIPSILNDDAVLEPYAEAAKKRWQAEIERLERLDATETYPDDAILFIGSSSVRLWDTIARDMSPYTPINRGYGGAKFSDLAVFVKRLITPHQYRAIVVFAANDVVGKAGDRTPEEVEALARYICDASRQHQPQAPVFLVEITPTPSRFAHWPAICEVNAKLRGITLTKPGTHFIATADRYLDEAKRPRGEFFREDRLHQNEAGYALWSELIKQRLNEVLK